MTPILARLSRGRQIVRCWVGRHELAAEVPTDETGARQPVIRQRCLHCGLVTDGWEIGREGPRYHITHAANRLKLTLHNGRLRRCACRDCETKRAARRTRRVVRLSKAS